MVVIGLYVCWVKPPLGSSGNLGFWEAVPENGVALEVVQSASAVQLFSEVLVPFLFGALLDHLPVLLQAPGSLVAAW